MGLSYDPFDMVDDYLAESAGNRAAFLSQMGQDAKALALVSATIASYLPFPGVGLVGDLALYAMGEQSSFELGAGIALGLIPGGKLLGKLGGFTSKLGASAWKSAKHYAGRFGGFVAKGAGRAGELVGSLARRAKNFLDRKPRAACGCFAAATLVWTPAGAVPIVDLEQGTAVFAAADDTSPEAMVSDTVGEKIIIGNAAEVLLFVRHADNSTETVHTTDEHPFHLLETGDWTRADALPIGGHLSAINGDAELLAVAYTGTRVPVYNLSIPDHPTYFVGEHGLWVHNCDISISQYIKTNSRNIAKGRSIRKIDILLDKWGGKAKNWTKKAGKNENGVEFHWYEKNGQVFGAKRAGEPDPF